MTLEELNVVVTATTEDALAKLDRLAEALRALATAEDGAETFAPRADTTAAERAAQSLTSRLQALKTGLNRASDASDAQKAWRTLKERFDAASRSGGDTGDTLAEMTALCRKAGVAFGGMASDVSGADKGFAALADGTSASAAVVSGVIAGLNADCASLRAAMQLHGSVTLDTSNAIAAVAGVIAAIGALAGAAAAAGVSLTSARQTVKPRGGGGRATSDEDAWKDRYKEELAWLEHLKALDQISLEGEIAYLQKMQKRYQAYAEARMELEERVYEAAQAIRRRDADALDSLAEGLTTALANRYQAALDAETAALAKSGKRWEAWRDQNVAAIQAQIDALDALTAAEDREAAETDDQRRIASLREQIAFERDDYSRAMLQKQLEQALADRDKRLAAEQRADDRAALQAQLTETEARAQTELDALDKRRDAIEAYYADRLKAASLEAEAERLLLSRSQSELLKLLQSFAPEYDLLGRTLGERLLTGFTSRVGDVGKWFKRLTDQLGAAQSALASGAGEATASRVVTVHQQNVFNQPIESPSQVARRVQSVNEALADELLGA